MNVDILGLGPTLEKFLHAPITNNLTIGVNDIWKHYPVDKLVCVDLPTRFSKERRLVIENSRPQNFYTQSDKWVYHKAYSPITLARKRGDVSNFDWQSVPYSNNSTFVACSIAYLLGATSIVMWGVDFTNHKELNANGNDIMAFNHFLRLRNELNKRGCKLFVGDKGSALSKFIPVQQIS